MVLLFNSLSEMNDSLREAQKCLQYKADSEIVLLREHFKENLACTLQSEK